MLLVFSLVAGLVPQLRRDVPALGGDDDVVVAISWLMESAGNGNAVQLIVDVLPRAASRCSTPKEGEFCLWLTFQFLVLAVMMNLFFVGSGDDR